MAGNEALLDKPREVREEERFDVSAMDDWLKQQLPSLQGEPTIKQFSGGASNLTYMLSYPERDLILRRPPFGHKAKGAHDMAREFRIQQSLKPVYPAVPTMVALCEDSAVMGCDFYVMDRIKGIIPRANLPKELALSEGQTRQLCHGVIDKLIELHQVDYQAAGLEHIGKGGGYVKRQITGWSDRYEKSKTWNVPGWTSVRNWLHANMPDDVGTVIIHNDYRMDNLVLDADDPQNIIGVLDWEMATLGDPLMDLGNTLAYWVQADDDRINTLLRRQPTHLPGMLTRREVVDYYCDKMNLKADNWTFYEVYGLFRLAVIVQQIYYRYHHKQTRNPAFKHFWLFNHYLQHTCKKVIKGKR
ncbi:phosphotransferase family protein [Alcanivorax sp. 1008]|uniref:phosphotransferase family protein n=1 Tax=Alcanivorax sp. 1008 TaxID=2816853 RepID=UPI001D2E90F7|nr:phosphotransferase family protein [Alcanivorax sp. 1008]MCC1497384.1 phosphotransferase family protein [Alcanivorax sp. 1008]